jgi:predicted Zn-dependent protease
MKTQYSLRALFRWMVLTGISLCLLAACATVPVSGRNQLNLIPSQQLLAMSNESYQQVISQYNVVRGTREARLLDEVGRNIARAVERYLRQQGNAEALTGYDWEFTLVRDDQVNAFAVPGGKVVVFSGMLPVTQNAAGLATVVSHEIAHVIARHGNERLSQQMVAQLGVNALDVALQKQPAKTRQLYMQAFGLGAQFGVLLPYSRLQESEADKLGLIFMAMAGYNPQNAINFWQRMAAEKSGQAPPEFMSTHPSHGTRIEDIREFMPKAMRYYRG